MQGESFSTLDDNKVAFLAAFLFFFKSGEIKKTKKKDTWIYSSGIHEEKNPFGAEQRFRNENRNGYGSFCYHLSEDTDIYSSASYFVGRVHKNV